MSVHLNDLSKVYLNNIFESSHEKEDDEPKMKKRHKKNDEADDNEKEDEENEDQPRWQDSDRDGEWYEPGEDVAAPKKKKVTKESFSNWREDLAEVVGKGGKDQNKPNSNEQIKEKEVKNNITINPEIKEQVQILESVELSEDYIDKIIDLASQYFYSEGYDDKSVKIIAEGMGQNQFVDFVFDIGNTFFLNEAAYQGELLTSTGKARKNPKVSAAKGASTPVAHTPSTAKKKKPEEKKTSSGQLSINYNKKPSPPGQEKIKQAVGNAVKSATSTQTRKAVGKAAGSAVKGAANTAARAALSAWKGHQAAMKRKGEGATVAQQVGAGLGAAAGAFFKKGKEHLKNSYEFTDWLDYIISEGCDISEWTISNLYKHYRLNEAVYGNFEEKFSMTADSSKPQSSKPTKLPVGREKNIGKHDDWKDKPTEWGKRPAAGNKLKSRLTAVVGTQKRQDKETGIVAHYEPKGSVLGEKAESEQQQKLFGLALSVKRGKTSKSGVSQAVLDIVNKMSEKEIRKYAGTSHEGIPKRKVKEQLEPTTPDQIAAQRKIAIAQDQLNKANKKSLSQKQKTQTTQNVNAGYKLEGNLVDEATPTKLFYKLQAKGKKDSPTGAAQRKSDADLETQKNLKMKAQQSKQRYEREPEDDHPSLSARERNPNLR